MLKALDLVLFGVMVVAATITYSIKHKADEKQQEVRRLEAEIKLEKDTIDLLRADWALLTQPNRLEKLVNTYNAQLKLVRTEPTQLAQPSELPMLKSQVPQPAVADAADDKNAKDGKTASATAAVAAATKALATVAATKPAAPKTAAALPRTPAGGIAIPAQRPDSIKTGSVKP